MALSRTSRRRLLAVALLVVASAFSVSLVALRFVLSGAPRYENLVWNLVLAWVPFVLALIAYDRHRRGSRGLALWLPLALWLAFLPNAPYLVTDFMLLRDIRDMPVWFDVALLTSFAWTGLLLGFASVYLVQDLARRAVGPSAPGSASSARSAPAGSGSTSAASCAGTAGTCSCSRRACSATWPRGSSRRGSSA